MIAEVHAAVFPKPWSKVTCPVWLSSLLTSSPDGPSVAGYLDSGSEAPSYPSENCAGDWSASPPGPRIVAMVVISASLAPPVRAPTNGCYAVARRGFIPPGVLPSNAIAAQRDG